MTKLTADAILDHAGAYYPWFYIVDRKDDGTVQVIGHTEYTADVPEIRNTATLTVADLRASMVALLAADTLNDYANGFIADTLAGRYDDADGDADVVDCILQHAMWGTVIFG